MKGRGEKTREDTARPGMPCKDNTRRGGEGIDDPKCPANVADIGLFHIDMRKRYVLSGRCFLSASRNEK